MRLIPFRRAREPNPLVGHQPSEGEQSTLALADAITPLRARTGARILDLGSARGENVEFFSELGCQLEIIDLYSQLREVNFSTERLDDVLSAVGPNRDRYDLILAWDLLDYLKDDQIAHLFAKLEPRCGPGTRILAFVSYQSTMPMQPRNHTIKSSSMLIATESGGSKRPSPRHKEPKLLRLLPGFEVETSYLMRHGSQEYVFVRTAPPEHSDASRANGTH